MVCLKFQSSYIHNLPFYSMFLIISHTCLLSSVINTTIQRQRVPNFSSDVTISWKVRPKNLTLFRLRPKTPAAFARQQMAALRGENVHNHE